MRRQRSAFLAAFLALSLCVLLPAACFLIGEGQQRRSDALPAGSQGLYEYCAPVTGIRCLDRLKQMAAAGFKLVLNYAQLYGTANEELVYAEQAQELGLKVIWAMNNPVFWNGTDLRGYYRTLAATCDCSDNRHFIRYVVHLVAGLPATWGYYIGEEVPRDDYARMAAFADYVRQLDPSHPRLYVAGGNFATNGANLEPFAGVAEFIGADIYPIGTSQPVAAVGQMARAIRSIAEHHHKQPIIVLQAFSFAEYPQESRLCAPFPACARFPTEAEMRQMRELALSNAHPQFLLWYSYFDILRSDHPAGHWADLVAAAGTD